MPEAPTIRGLIETQEALDGLDFPCVVREIPTDITEFYPQIWEMTFQSGWARAGRDFDPQDSSPRLPVQVLWDMSDHDQLYPRRVVMGAPLDGADHA